MSDIWVVDLSHHNTVKSFSAAAADGLLGVVHKATEGDSYEDPTYKERESHARGAGLFWIPYHFMRPGDQSEHLKHFLAYAEPREGERIVFDYEDDRLNLDHLYSAMECVSRARPDLQQTLYSGHLIKEQLGDTFDPLLAKISLWIAQYTAAEAPSWPKGTWPAWSLWQYTDGNSGGSPRVVNGIIPPTDCNRFNGTLENCIRWLGPARVQTEGPEPVRMVVDVPVGVILEIHVTGSGAVTVTEE